MKCAHCMWDQANPVVHDAVTVARGWAVCSMHFLMVRDQVMREQRQLREDQREPGPGGF